jgi:hypothetical protein
MFFSINIYTEIKKIELAPKLYLIETLKTMME